MVATLAVLIVEYHCIDQVEQCLPALKRHLQGIDLECVVVSNSEYSTSELRDAETRLAAARVVANDRNRGYAGGVNRGLAECNAEIILVLNPDCLLTDGNIPALVDLLDVRKDIAVVGPRVVDEAGDVQPSCRRFPRLYTFLLVRSALAKLPGAGHERRRYLMEDFAHDRDREVDWVSGGAMLVRRAAVTSVGAMDERYFLYMEDVDWCRRFWKGGWTVLYSPRATVMHAGQHQSLQGGLKRISSPHTRYHLASMFRYFLKHGLRVNRR